MQQMSYNSTHAALTSEATLLGGGLRKQCEHSSPHSLVQHLNGAESPPSCFFLQARNPPEFYLPCSDLSLAGQRATSNLNSTHLAMEIYLLKINCLRILKNCHVLSPSLVHRFGPTGTLLQNHFSRGWSTISSYQSDQLQLVHHPSVWDGHQSLPLCDDNQTSPAPPTPKCQRKRS